MYSDSRTHGYQGPSRTVRLPRATSSGGGAIAKSEDGSRCVVAGRESLRILRISAPTGGELPPVTEHRHAIGQGGHRIEISRNLWDGSSLHIDSASTDVAWGHGMFNNKILTSARNGELIMWDLNKTGPSKFERKTRDHSRSIHTLSYSPVLDYYCLTGSADGDLRVWDLRDLTRSIMWIRHPSAVRSVVFSPVQWQPLQAITALDNGSIYRWDLKVGQRGQMDRIPAAHAGPILSVDWTAPPKSVPSRASQSSWYGGSGSALGLLDDIIPRSGPGGGESDGTGACWIVSGGLDKRVKVWDLAASTTKSHTSRDPMYTIHTAYPVRRVRWRPEYECELAIVSHADSSGNRGDSLAAPDANSMLSAPDMMAGMVSALSSPRLGTVDLKRPVEGIPRRDERRAIAGSGTNDPVEIWDVRRGFIAKWNVADSAVEGSVTDIVFKDSHALWAQHATGTFSQLDLRNCSRPLDAIPRVSASWDVVGSLAFVADRPRRWEVPYDDLNIDKRQPFQEWAGIHKTLGDSPYAPVSQSMGIVSYEENGDELETFVKCAQGYIYEGSSNRFICSHNAKVAAEAGKFEAAQAWLLLDNLLTDLAPETLPSATISHSIPSASLPYHSSTLSTEPTMSPLTLSTTLPKQESRQSNSHESIGDVYSATYSLPRLSVSLPQLPSVSWHEAEIEYHPPVRPRLSSSYRQSSSGSIHRMHSDSSNRRSGEDGHDRPASPKNIEFEEGSSRAPLNSPYLGHVPHSSPLLQSEVGRAQGKEEELLSSPSASDSELDEIIPLRRRTTRASRRSSMRSRSRSRNSTIASLAASSTPQTLPKHIPHDDSQNGNNLGEANANKLRRTSSTTHRRANSEIPPIHHSNVNGDFAKAVKEKEKRYRDLAWDALRETFESLAEEGDVQSCTFLSIVASKEFRVTKTRCARFIESYLEILNRLRLFTCAAYIRKFVEFETIRSATIIETTMYTSCGRCRKSILMPASKMTHAGRPAGCYAYCLACKTSTTACAICHLPVRSLLFECPVCMHGGHQECYRKYYMRRPMVQLSEPPPREHEQLPPRPATISAPEPPSQGRTRAPSQSGSLHGRDSDGESDVGSVLRHGASTASAIGGASDHGGLVDLRRILHGHPCAAGCGHYCWAANSQ